MTGRVVTVLGPISPEELGLTLGHEHLLFDLRCLWEQPPPERAHLADAEPSLENRGELSRDLYDSQPNLFLDDPAVSVAEVGRLRSVGGSAIVDLTTIGLAPNPEALREISTATGVHVVAGAGYYRQKCLPADVLERSVEALADELQRWVAEGMYGTSVRAGILGELGTSSPIQPFEERQLRAAARVQRATGVAINVHPAIWSHEHLRVLDILESEGADLGRVALSHCDELVEPEWHARIAERGATLCFDTFGAEFSYDADGTQEPRDTDRIACLTRLLEAGRGAQLLLSHDICTRLQLRRYGGLGFDHIPLSVVPRIRSAGVSEVEVAQMLVDNPRALLTMPV
jgi:phosphotriesterase-related protein